MRLVTLSSTKGDRNNSGDISVNVASTFRRKTWRMLYETHLSFDEVSLPHLHTTVQRLELLAGHFR